MRKSVLYVLCLIVLSVPDRAAAVTVSYEFDIDYRAIKITGEAVTALVIDGNIPGPTIEADLNDTLRITFNNRMDVDTE